MLFVLNSLKLINHLISTTFFFSLVQINHLFLNTLTKWSHVGCVWRKYE